MLQSGLYEGFIVNERLKRWVAFGEEISERRQWLGKKHGRKITQKEIAQQIGITEKQLSRIETAISGTDYNTVQRLADALEYSEIERPALFALAGMAYQSKEGTVMMEMAPEAHDGPDVLNLRYLTPEDREGIRQIFRSLLRHSQKSSTN